MRSKSPRTREPRKVGARPSLGALASLVGFLTFVEFVSGFIQGYYVPMMSDIARHLHITDADVNWLEGSQLMLSVLAVPALAKLGDMVGPKRILLWATAITAVTTLALAFTDSFPLFFAAWTLQGVYVVWLPLEIALIWSRSRGMESRAAVTARAAGLLVAALEVGAISGALLGGAFIDALPLFVVFLVPGLLVTASFFVILGGVAESRLRTGGRFDYVGLCLISFALLAFTGGLSLLRLNGFGSPLPWLVSVLGLLLVIPFVRWELRQHDPLIDVRLFRSPALAPVFVTAALFGMSVLGAQAPLSTFLRTDPEVYGYGLGTKGFTTSLVVGLYLIAMMIGALCYSRVARLVTPRRTLAAATVLVGTGFLLMLPFHGSLLQVITNFVITGAGAGALIAALPSAAAAGAPSNRTSVATGLTNSSKTLGGAIASAIFGIALLQGSTGAGSGGTAGSFEGYITVWLTCSLSAFLATAVLLFIVPKSAFQDRAPAPSE
ncbi:MAG: MFS transporter [Leucobacter sp.]